MPKHYLTKTHNKNLCGELGVLFIFIHTGEINFYLCNSGKNYNNGFETYTEKQRRHTGR